MAFFVCRSEDRELTINELHQQLSNAQERYVFAYIVDGLGHSDGDMLSVT